MNNSCCHLFLSFVSLVLLSACAGLQSDLPSPSALVERHLQATYPDGDPDSRPTISMRGRLLIEDFGVDAPISLRVKAPDKRMFSARVLGQDVVRSCSGKVCWAQELESPVVRLQGAELAFMQELSDFYRLQELKRYYRSVKTLGLTEFNTLPAYEVQLIRNNGNEDRWYFAQDSGFWLGGAWQLPRDMGGARITQIFDSYRSFDGLYVATQIMELAPGQTSLIVIEEVSFKPIADQLFDLESR